MTKAQSRCHLPQGTIRVRDYCMVRQVVHHLQIILSGSGRDDGRAWPVDETYIAIKGIWRYLYRAVEKQGMTIDFLLREDRAIEAARAFFRPLTAHSDRPPRKATLDGHRPSHRALRLLHREHPAWRRVKVRRPKYLNNLIEQDQRAIEQRYAPMKGFKSFANAGITIAGIELAHRLHKHQCTGTDVPGRCG
jgi:transposase-like protein